MLILSHFKTMALGGTPLDPPSRGVGAFTKARCSLSGSVALALYKAGAPFGRRCQKGKRRRARDREREREKRSKRSGEETRAGDTNAG